MQCEPSDMHRMIASTADTDVYAIHERRDEHWVIAGLLPGSSYAFKVAGVNDVGPGEWSLPSNEVAPDCKYAFIIGDSCVCAQYA